MSRIISQVVRILSLSVFILQLLICRTSSESCSAKRQVFGENDIIDRLVACAISKSSDIDLTSNGEQFKSTAKSLVEQGLAEKTSISYARLSGLWTARRPRFVETGWICEPNKTTVTSLIEITGLTLSVIERLDIPADRGQQTSSLHNPCETFKLPVSLCQQSRPIYRVVKTWADKAYFNLTLSQAFQLVRKPNIDMILPIFTCPETFRQRISYSPSAIYILPGYATVTGELQGNGRENWLESEIATESDAFAPLVNPITHPISFASTQSDKGSIMSSYPSSTKSIMNKAIQVLRSSLEECIELLDSDLSPMADHTSFGSQKYVIKSTDIHDGGNNACSDKNRLAKIIDIASRAAESSTFGTDKRDSIQQAGYSRRSQTVLMYPNDADQLLDPFGHYVVDTDQMIDDNALSEQDVVKSSQS